MNGHSCRSIGEAIGHAAAALLRRVDVKGKRVSDKHGLWSGGGAQVNRRGVEGEGLDSAVGRFQTFHRLDSDHRQVTVAKGLNVHVDLHA